MSTSGDAKPKLLTLQDYLDNFPFPEIRPNQREALEQICDAYNSGYRYVVLEAPTGFGKSPVAVCVASTLGSSYTCSATKELQTQYMTDSPYLQTVKGMGEFTCLVREDFERENNFHCSECGPNATFLECQHTTVVHAPCRSNQPGYSVVYDHGKLIDRGCRYKSALIDYQLVHPGTDNERVVFTGNIESQVFNQRDPWLHFTSLTNPRSNFRPCQYFDQRNKGLLATHSILNYSNFQIFLRISDGFIPQKDLLILDEGHLIENEVVRFAEIAVSKRALSRYLRPINVKFIEKFIQKQAYNDDIKAFWVDRFLNPLYDRLLADIPYIESSERRIQAEEYMNNLEWKIYNLDSDPDNWIVTDIDIQKHKVKFKPLDVSKFCGPLLTKCRKNLIMSATILDVDTFCRSIGLPRDQVKFIAIGSDFPIENRPIYPLNVAYLNYASIHSEQVQRLLVQIIDKIMNKFDDKKGIIHTTSYDQVRFIQKYLSVQNQKRLIASDPKIKRDDIIADHINNDNSGRPSVLISPSMKLGLDLKDDRSRFQVIVKVPYPNKGDRWTDMKRERDPAWYDWQTALSLVQAYGRSVRSKDDWAYTFILDSAFKTFLMKVRGILPIWFTEAIR